MSFIGNILKPVTREIKAGVSQVKSIKRQASTAYKNEVTAPINSAKKYYDKQVKPDLPKAPTAFSRVDSNYASKLNKRVLF
jgi:hypothetical protein